MSTTDMPAALAREAVETTDEAQAARGQGIETALAVLFAAVGVLFASFLAVVTGLV
jgi:hypothetical protein